MNTHQGHPATCLCCKHLASIFDEDVSDVTPGMGDIYRCNKGLFLPIEATDEIELHEAIQTGATCEEFEGRE